MHRHRKEHEVTLEDLSRQICDMKKSLRGVDASISCLNMLYDKMHHHMEYDNGCYHQINGSHRYPTHITIEEKRKLMPKILDATLKYYGKRIKVHPPRDGRSRPGAIYFIDIPVGLREECIKKRHHQEGCVKDEDISKDVFFEIINRIKCTLLRPKDFTLSEPIPICDHNFNTEIILTPIKTSNYTGDITLRYNRTPISHLFQQHIRLNDTTSKTISELVRKLKLPLLPSDYIDQDLPPYDENFPYATRKINIKANEYSLLYHGQVTVDLSYKEIYFNPDGSIEEGDNHEPTEMEKLPNKDILVIKDVDEDNTSVVIYRDNTPEGNNVYTKDDGVVMFENTGEGENGYKKIKITSVFRINHDRYALYGEFDLSYKNYKDEVIYYKGNSILVNRNFRVIRGEDNLFYATEYNAKTMIVTSDLRVVVIAKENGVYTIYWFCSYGHLLTSVSIQKDSSIVPVRLYRANDGNVYVIGETIDKVYKIYKIDYTGSLTPYRDDQGNIVPFEPIEVGCSNPNVNPPDIMDIKDDANYETYIWFRPISNYSVSSPYPLIEDQRYFIDNTSISSSWNPIRKFNILGMMNKSFKPYFPYIASDVVSTITEDDILEDSLDTRLSLDGRDPRISFFTKKISPVSGIESYEFTVLDTDGNNITHRYSNYTDMIITKVYGVYKLIEYKTAVSCHLYKDKNGEVVDKDAILIYDRNYNVISTQYINIMTA